MTTHQNYQMAFTTLHCDNLGVVAEQNFKLAIIEDDIALLTLTSSLLEKSGHLILGATTSSLEGINFAKLPGLDCLIVDIDLGAGLSGIDIAVAVRKIRPQLPILFYSSHRYLNALNIPTELMYTCEILSKFEFVKDGQIYSKILSAISMMKVSNQPPSIGIARTVSQIKEQISKSDYELLELISKGYSNREIASQRNIEVKSCENMIARLAKKLEIVRTDKINQRILLARKFHLIAGKLQA